MKRVYIMIGLAVLLSVEVDAQTYMSVDKAHIQSPPNASYQNNSQFYNKDNKVNTNNISPSSNGTYWYPGYSNDANRSRTSNGLIQNTSVNSSLNTSTNNYYNSTINNNINATGTNFVPNDVVVPTQIVSPSNSMATKP